MSSLYKARVRKNPDAISSFDIFESFLTVNSSTFFGYGESPDDALVDLQAAVIGGLADSTAVTLDLELPDGLDAPTSEYGGVTGYALPETYMGGEATEKVTYDESTGGYFNLGSFVQESKYEAEVAQRKAAEAMADRWRQLCAEQDNKIVELQKRTRYLDEVNGAMRKALDTARFERIEARNSSFGYRVDANRARAAADEALELAHTHYVASLPIRLLIEGVTDAGTAMLEALRG